MSIFELIESTKDLQKLRKIYNNLPGNADLLSSVTVKHSHDDLTHAKIEVLAKINEIRGH